MLDIYWQRILNYSDLVSNLLICKFSDRDWTHMLADDNIVLSHIWFIRTNILCLLWFALSSINLHAAFPANLYHYRQVVRSLRYFPEGMEIEKKGKRKKKAKKNKILWQGKHLSKRRQPRLFYYLGLCHLWWPRRVENIDRLSLTAFSRLHWQSLSGL